MTNLATNIETIDLTAHQQASYDQLSDFCLAESGESLMTLTGYAGTGKTTLISQLVAQMASEGLSIAIAAPTNKAVGVLKEKITAAVDFGSIHSFLGLRMKERDNGDQECKPEGRSSLHQYDLVIIDEASMISHDLFRMIALNLRGSTRVIFIGDPCQLPPVGDSEESPVFNTVQRRTTLSEVVRQAADNPIIALSMKIRACIEANERTTPLTIADTLPPVETNPAACVANGGQDTIKSWALYEIKAGNDCRILAYTNAQVKRYNADIHESLYGYTECAYVVGEKIIVHEQAEAQNVEHGRETLYTSEELVVKEIVPKPHPKFDEINAFELTLERDSGSLVKVFIPANDEQLEAMISANFQVWREIKSEAKRLKAAGDMTYPLKEQEAKQYSSKAWALRKTYAQLRHVYAITTHKSQGSTFDTAIVDFSDLSKMQNNFEFNRALYVAITRPRNHLALVV